MRRFITFAIVTVAALIPTVAQAGPLSDLVDSWYVRYLGRHGDPIGMQSHLTALQNGTPPIEVEAAILGSYEYYSRHGRTPERFVTAMFVDVVGRRPTPQEFRFWINRLEQTGDRLALAVDFLSDHATPGPTSYAPSYIAPTTSYYTPRYVVPATPYYGYGPAAAIRVSSSPGVSIGLRVGR